MSLDVLLGGSNNPQRVLLTRLAGFSPRRNAVPAENAADCLRVLLLDPSDIETQLETRSPPGDPDDFGAKNFRRQFFTVHSSGDCNTRIGMQVVDMVRVDQGVHGGIDRGSSATLSVGAIVERFNHLVFALKTRIDVHELPHSIELENSETGFRQCSKVPAGPLHIEQRDVHARHRVFAHAFRAGVPTSKIGVSRVGSEPARSLNEITGFLAH